MDIFAKKTPDAHHMNVLKFQQEMAGSRSFLVVLLLATVTLIVLIQISMDGWLHPGNFKFYNFTVINQTEFRIDKNQDGSKVAPPLKNVALTSITSLTAAPKQILLHKVTSVPVKTEKKYVQKLSSTLAPQIETKVKNVGVGRSIKLSSEKQLPLFPQPMIPSNINPLLMRRRARYDPFKSVKTLPVVDPTKVNRIFLITYFRSGSSFVGELLQQNPKIFYQYEPLHYMTYGSRISDPQKTKEALKLLNSLYRCNFTGLDYYLQWIKKAKNQFLFSRSLFLWSTCRINHRICFVPEYVSTVCSRSPVMIVKTTRLHMWQLKLFLDDNPDLNIKVVYLARDPRGILSSRMALSDWCDESNCSNPNVTCSEMRNDISIFNELQRGNPSKFIQIRYEDMAVNPEVETDRLFKFLDLPVTRTIKTYLKTHTTAKTTAHLDPYSTRRNSSSAAFSWKKRLDFDQVSEIQKDCSDVLEKLNYLKINKESELDAFKDKETLKQKITYINNHRNVFRRRSVKLPDRTKITSTNNSKPKNPYLNMTISEFLKNRDKLNHVKN